MEKIRVRVSGDMSQRGHNQVLGQGKVVGNAAGSVSQIAGFVRQRLPGVLPGVAARIRGPGAGIIAPPTAYAPPSGPGRVKDQEDYAGI